MRAQHHLGGRVIAGALLLCWLAPMRAQPRQTGQGKYTVPLPTGVRLDPVGEVVDLGSMPLAMALAPEGDKLVVVLSGFREQGIQVVDLKTRRVTQTLAQDGAFYGVAFSPDGKELFVSGGNTDSIFCYSWQGGTAALSKTIVLGKQKEDKTGSRYPAGLAVSKNGKYLYVAENVGDTLAVVNVESGEATQRFRTDHYPYAVEAAADGRVYVSAWGGDTVSVFHARVDGTLYYEHKVRVGRHPSALLANRAGTRLFATLSGTDQIAVLDTRAHTVLRYLSDAAPNGPAEGSTPNALALSADETQLYVAEADNNALAVFKLRAEGIDGKETQAQGPEGRIPVDWYPTAVLLNGNGILALSGKGHGTRANPDGPIPSEGLKRGLGYALGQLNGTLRTLPASLGAEQLAAFSKRVAAANGWGETRAVRRYPPFHHVVYIIKENRTYDQVFGDLKEGDGDPNLVFFDARSTPNHRALALRFGLFDRFFVNAEVSSQGHIWSTAAYVTEYGEKLVPSGYARKRGDVDGEEIDEPQDGFLWTLAAKKGVSFRDYGEMVAVPEGWPVTQREVAAEVSPSYPAFDLNVPDQKRADAWIAELRQFEKDGNMPQLEVLHLPNDHTAWARTGFHAPRALMADNDLALGRIVEALSKSVYWRDTVVFALEDDAQAGPDHLDSHRSVLLAISAYSRGGLVHRFVNTTDVVAAIEDILSLDHLSKFDYFSRSLADLFSPAPDLAAYEAIEPQQDRNEMNPPKTAAARMSEGLDLSRPDRVEDGLANRILWLSIKGDAPQPVAQRRAPLHVMQMSR